MLDERDGRGRDGDHPGAPAARGQQLERPELHGAQLHGAQLQGSRLQGSRLQGALPHGPGSQVGGQPVAGPPLEGTRSEPGPLAGNLTVARGREGAGPTVLIVDDDDAIREALEDVLSDEGYRVVGMSDGQQALEHLNAEGRPDAILLDLWMPVMDGWKFLDALLDDARFSRVPLVVLTAARDQRARELRVAEVLTKPVQLQQVLSALERLTKVS